VTLQELECAEKNMQQQWHDLVMAEQRGEALDVLEQMYDTYILLAEEYNRCSEAFEHEQDGKRGGRSAGKRHSNKRGYGSSDKDKEKDRVRLAS